MEWGEGSKLCTVAACGLRRLAAPAVGGGAAGVVESGVGDNGVRGRGGGGG